MFCSRLFLILVLVSFNSSYSSTATPCRKRGVFTQEQQKAFKYSFARGWNTMCKLLKNDPTIALKIDSDIFILDGLFRAHLPFFLQAHPTEPNAAFAGAAAGLGVYYHIYNATPPANQNLHFYQELCLYGAVIAYEELRVDIAITRLLKEYKNYHEIEQINLEFGFISMLKALYPEERKFDRYLECLSQQKETIKPTQHAPF